MSKTQKHFTPDGKVYKGDTHKAGSKLMTGAKQTPQSKTLTHTPLQKNKK